MYILERRNIKIWIDETEGMNITRIEYRGIPVVELNEERKKSGATYGVPILFPTPGRTQYSRFHFEGNEYDAIMHGLVRKLTFEIVNANKTSIEGRLVWNEEMSQYTYYPFSFIMNINIQLDEEEIVYNYSIKNIGEKTLGYGFALHPFFNNFQGKAKIKVSGKYAMETDEELIPNGRLIAAKENPNFDLSKYRNVQNLDLDTVYYGVDDEIAIIDFEEFCLRISATKDFGHVVVYTPNENYFCIEPQTSSADTFNLYNHGFESESGLQLINPDSERKGQIRFLFHI